MMRMCVDIFLKTLDWSKRPFVVTTTQFEKSTRSKHWSNDPRKLTWTNNFLYQQGFRLVRERRRVAWILLLLAVLFALCWLPYNVLRLLVDLGVISEYCFYFNLKMHTLFRNIILLDNQNKIKKSYLLDKLHTLKKFYLRGFATFNIFIFWV